MAATPPSRPTTSTGTLVAAVVPLPSLPREPAPQHLTPPAPVTAHVCRKPAAIARTPLPSPTTSIGSGAVVVPPFAGATPQHLTAPTLESAQVWCAPAATALMVGTWTAPAAAGIASGT